MTILNPFALLLLIVIPVFILFLIWRDYARQQAIKRVGNDELVKQLVSQVNITRRRIKSFLWLLTFAMLIIVLAHPVWGITAEIVNVEGRAIMFVVDVSRSMDTQDITPSRLDRAKIDITRIIQELNNDDIGFIVFAGEAFVYMPMTHDDHSIETFLSAISTRATTNQGTDIYTAIALATDIMSGYSVAEKHIVVMSDGENHEVSDPSGVQRAVENGIIIHTVGYGTIEGGEIPLYDNTGAIVGYQTDNGNVIVVSTLESAILEEIALQTGGNYFTTESIDFLISTLESGNAGELGQRTITQPIERFGIFLLLAIVLLSIEILLPETGKFNL